MLVAPVFTFVLAPIAGRISRRHEFRGRRVSGPRTPVVDDLPVR